MGVSKTELSKTAQVLDCLQGDLPFTYLGVPVGANMALKKNWKPILDKFSSNLSSWKAKSLSFGGRLTLIKSVLDCLPTYYMSLFKAPQGIIDQLDKIRRRFLWGGGELKKRYTGLIGKRLLHQNRKEVSVLVPYLLKISPY